VNVRVRCPAKINLHLEVVGTRADQYHELRTLFAAIGLWDELELAAAPPGVVDVTVEPPGAAPCGDDNLVVRAARALIARFGPAKGARMRLRKAIPAGGGLGGGSSDAAGALVGLSRLWGLDGSFAALHPVAGELGADVPFFLLGGVAWGVGRGAEVFPLPDLPAWWVVLVPGPAPISTADVYAGLDSRRLDTSAASELHRWVVAGGELPVSSCRNALESTVVARWPEVGRRLERVRATGPELALLAGSGATVFGVYFDAERARQAAERLAGDCPRVVPLLSRNASCLRPLEGEGRTHGDQ